MLDSERAELFEIGYRLFPADEGHIICGIASGIPLCCIKHFLECRALEETGQACHGLGQTDYHRCPDCVARGHAVPIFYHTTRQWAVRTPEEEKNLNLKILIQGE